MLFGGGAPAASKQGEKPRPREAKARLAKATRRRTTKMPRARGCVRGKNAFPFPALGYPCLRPVLHLWGVCETTLFWSIRSVDATDVGATSSLLVLDDLVMRCRRFASETSVWLLVSHTHALNCNQQQNRRQRAAGRAESSQDHQQHQPSKRRGTTSTKGPFLLHLCPIRGAASSTGIGPSSSTDRAAAAAAAADARVLYI